MEHSKVQCIDFIREKISTNEKWAMHGLLKIYEYQTEEEKNNSVTIDNNGIGFSGVDATFLTGVVKFYQENGFITNKQLRIVFTKMKKYAAQLYRISDKEKLYKAMENSGK